MSYRQCPGRGLTVMRRCKFLGSRLRQTPDREFGRAVHTQESEALVAGIRRRVDDLAFLLALSELFCGGLNAPHDAADVDLQDLVEFLGRDVDQRLNRGDARVVDDDVESAKFLSGDQGGVNIVRDLNVGP